jgi:hypothetical protein
MRHVSFDPSTLVGDARTWWDAWAATAEAATAQAIAAWEGGQDPSFVMPIWKQLKDWLLANVFHGKCAYCEAKIPRATYQAEHYRPKGRVAVKDAATGQSAVVKVRDPRGQEVDHPGYFWLAYHWKNLLPACEFCNTRRGKRDQFPIATGHEHLLLKRLTAQEVATLQAPSRVSETWPDRYYLDPDDLNLLEDPLLLHPYYDEPREHLHFGERGIVAAFEGSDKGPASLKVYDLDDEKLREARQIQQERALSQFFDALRFHERDGFKKAVEEAEARIEDFQLGKEAYSAAALDYVDLWRPRG